jgi:hypothetical protein
MRQKVKERLPSTRKARLTNTSRVKQVAGPATRPDAEFPPINLPVKPPYPSSLGLYDDKGLLDHVGFTSVSIESRAKK